MARFPVRVVRRSGTEDFARKIIECLGETDIAIDRRDSKRNTRIEEFSDRTSSGVDCFLFEMTTVL
jgi:hypothetical protein